MTDFFAGFERRRITTSGADINLVNGGEGPPLLLLHGYPQTHLMWRKLAPRLAQEFTVVVPDLRGYGDSSKPPAGSDNTNYSKRALAQDQVETMAALGFDRFAVAGHDRGARVAHRLARPSGANRALGVTRYRSDALSLRDDRSEIGHCELSLVLSNPTGRIARAADRGRARVLLAPLAPRSHRIRTRGFCGVSALLREPGDDQGDLRRISRRRDDRSRSRPRRSRPPPADAAPVVVGSAQLPRQRLRYSRRLVRSCRKRRRPRDRKRPFPAGRGARTHLPRAQGFLCGG